MALWLPIYDSESARAAVSRAARFTGAGSLVLLAIGLVGLFAGTSITEPSQSRFPGVLPPDGGDQTGNFAFVLLGAFLGTISLQLRKMSRGWALTGLVLILLTLAGDIKFARSLLDLIVHSAVMIYFVHAVRGTILFHRYEAASAASEKVTAAGES